MSAAPSAQEISRTILVAPDLLACNPDEGVVQHNLALDPRALEGGKLYRLPELPQVDAPEALYLGLGPEHAQIADGPLIVSALGADPPERSIQFHLSLMSVGAGVLHSPDVEPSGQELRDLLQEARRLNTRTLTLVGGSGLDHGLVWEGLGDMRTFSPRQVDGKAMREHMPEGDADRLLRRFIDDSVNLLSDLELNLRRADEGLPVFNTLWPWGQGIRPKLPNLALRRGMPALVVSEQLRMLGLSRWVGYRHTDIDAFRRGINLDLSKLASLALETPLSFVLVSGPQTLRTLGKLEELEWFVDRMGKELLQPLVSEVIRGSRRMLILAPSFRCDGLALVLEPSPEAQNVYPFDERSLSESAVPLANMARLIEDACH